MRAPTLAPTLAPTPTLARSLILTLTLTRYSSADNSLDLPCFVDAFEAAERVISAYEP
jgi:hypothetical protein